MWARLLLLIQLLAALNASANSNGGVPFRFGFELTLTNPEIQAAKIAVIEYEKSPFYQEKIEEYFRVWHFWRDLYDIEVERSADRVFSNPRGERFLSIGSSSTTFLQRKVEGTPLAFFIGHDERVIEISSSSSAFSVKELRGIQPFMEELIFRSGEQAGLRPDVLGEIGGGHVNISVEPFRKAKRGGLWFLNTLIWLNNSYELFSGVLSNDWLMNSKPLQASPERWAEFQEFVREAKALGPEVSYWDARKLAERYFFRPDSVNNSLFGRPVEANMALALRGSHGSTDERLELRGVRPQASFEQFVIQAEIFENLFERLSLLTEVLDARGFSRGELVSPEQITDEERFRAFKDLTEGYDLERALEILPQDLVERFGPFRESQASSSVRRESPSRLRRAVRGWLAKISGPKDSASLRCSVFLNSR